MVPLAVVVGLPTALAPPLTSLMELMLSVPPPLMLVLPV